VIENRRENHEQCGKNCGENYGENCGENCFEGHFLGYICHEERQSLTMKISLVMKILPETKTVSKNFSIVPYPFLKTFFMYYTYFYYYKEVVI
jgi:hypothetical protein